MSAYYNEIDKFAAAWLRELILEGLIPQGDVDERDITDVHPNDLVGYVQCHFFAGICGWPLALRLAGWPDDKPVWTGSCPCQPFSTAGKGGGFADERHLWPSWHYLIEQLRPPVIFGEQVASPDGLAWLDLVSSDLEGAYYAFGAVDICSAGVGAPHIRQRLFWVADAAQPDQRRYAGEPRIETVTSCGQTRTSDGYSVGGSSATSELGNAPRGGQRRPRIGETGDGREVPAGRSSPWGDTEWLHCRDGKARPTKPGIFPLAHGVPNRVGTLRGAGNAINPWLAKEFIETFINS